MNAAMSPALETFDRLKAKGIAAYRRGEYPVARGYLLDAADCLLEQAAKAPTAELRRQHEACAAELMDLARECARQPAVRPGRQRATDGGEPSGDGSEWILRDKPRVRFADIAGLEDVKTEICMKMIYPLQHPELAARYGISTGGGVLLYGPPGTGKTMMAKAIACELDATFFAISPAQILSKWVGEAEQNLRKLFEAARREPMAVIFMDEIEAMVPRRKSDSSTVMQRVVPQILQELEGVATDDTRPLLFVGATNKPWMLDEAIMRPGRFDARILVPLPDAPARYKLLEIYLGARPLAEDVDLGVLCDLTNGYSGADIASIAEQAARAAFLESIAGKGTRSITMNDIRTILEATPPSVKPPDLARFQRFAETGR